MKRIIGIALIVAVGALAGCKKEDAEATKDEDRKSAKDDDDGDKGKDDKKDDKGAAKAEEKKAEAPKTAGAAAHLASSCEVVGRVDIKRILESPVVKDNVVPALQELKTKEPKADDDKRFKAFLEETGIDPLKDLNELAICVTDVKNAASGKGEPGFSVILGGNFKAGSIVPALLKHGKKDKFKETDVGGTKALTDDKGEMFMGQAGDGSVLLARTKPPFESALATSDAASATFQLPVDQAITLVIPAETVKMAMEQGGNNPFKQHAANMGRMAFTFDIAAAQMQMRVACKDDKSAIELGGFVKTVLGEVTKAPPRPGDPTAMAAAMLKDAKVDYEGKELVIKVSVPKEQLETAAKEVAASIRKEMQ